MSFFANLVAGLGTGLGKGLEAEANYQDKLEMQRALLEEKQRDKLEAMQRDRDLKLELAAMRNPSGGASGGSDLFGMLRSAKTPEEQRQVLGYIKSFAGPEAAMLLEENVFGRIPMQERQYETIDALGDGTSGGRTSVSERVAYDRDQGQKALGRVYALLANKGQTKSHAEGEAQYFSNDMQAIAVGQELRKGKTLVEAAETGARVADPAEYDKNKTNRERIEASLSNAGTRAATSASTTDVRELGAALRSKESQRTSLTKALAQTYDDGVKALMRGQIEQLDQEIADLKSKAQQAPATHSSTPGFTVSGSAKPASGKLPTLDQLRAKHALR